MKFIVSSTSLLKKIIKASGAISTHPPVPILENFLFQINKKELTIIASDLNTTIITNIEVEGKDSANIAIPSKMLIDTLKNLPEQPITFSIDNDNLSIEISTDTGKYKLIGYEAEDFPRTPVIDNANSINMSSDILFAAVTNTIFATSNDEMKKAFSGVNLTLTPTNATFASSDGHKLVRFRRVDITSEKETKMLFPKKALNLLKTTFSEENINVNISYNSSHASFEFDNMKVLCRLVDANFPNYENIIPENNKNIITVEREKILNALRGISIYTNKVTHLAKLSITGSLLTISGQDVEFSNEAEEKLTIEHDGEDMDIGFNVKYLIEMLSVLKGEKIILKLSSPDKPGLLIPKDQENAENILMLLMPFKLG